MCVHDRRRVRNLLVRYVTPDWSAYSYRRGKPESNDVDIVFTHPDAAKIKGLCKRFVRRLHERGMVTHVMRMSSPSPSLRSHSSPICLADVSGFHGHNPLRTHHWDSLEKALTVFILPPSSPFYSGTRRRLDLIFAPPEVYWTAVIGWWVRCRRRLRGC